MRLIIVLLTAGIMQVSASSFAQNLTYSKQGASLHEIFVQIRKQTNYLIIYSDKKIDDTQKLDVNFNNTPIKEVLDLISEQQSFLYLIDEKTISIKPKESTFLEGLANRWAAIDVHGRVVDQEGKPLSGATVKVKSTGKSVSTNAKGEFYLEKVGEGEVLVISFIGYVSKEVDAGKEMGNVALEINDSKLDEIQVIAYGTTTRRLSTGNISSITSADIEKQPVSNPLLALQGRVPGLQITQSTGFSGSGVIITIQGMNSLMNGVAPFYVIDGVPFAQALLPNLGNILGSSGRGTGANNGPGNPLSFVNLADIESIEVLKDADATAIYGSRAANGAIIITTKKAKLGRMMTTLEVRKGFSEVANKLKLLNIQQYLEMRNEAIANDNRSIGSTDYDLNNTWDTTKNTDWQRELLGNKGHYTDAQLSFSGGNANTQYFINSGYHKETNIFSDKLSDQKVSLKFDLNGISNNQKFRVNISGSYLADNNKLPNLDLTQIAMILPPNTPDLLNADGSINWAPVNGVSTNRLNPYGRLESVYKNNTRNLISNSVVSYEIRSGLIAKVSLGYTDLTTEEISTSPLTGVVPEFRPYATRTALYGFNGIRSWIIEPQLNYKIPVKQNFVDILIGATAQQSNSSRKLIEGKGYATDYVLENINAATSITSPGGSAISTQYKYNAGFFRINYNAGDKYILNLSGRRDGSSRFGPANRFHNFGAVGVAWLLSNEPWIMRNLVFLSNAKIRTSYGTTGNDQIGDYSYLSLYQYNNTDVAYRGGTSLMVNRIFNPYLQWEETKKFSIGLDLGFIKDRVLMNVTYFRNHSSNMLMPATLPATSGGSMTINLPADIQNMGIESSINAVNVKHRSFSWSTDFNITIPRNILRSFKGIENTPYAYIYVVGQPINVQAVYRFKDVNPISGVYDFFDKNNKITDNPASDFGNFNKLMNPNPRFYGGINNTFTFKGFNLNLLFQFAKQSGQNIPVGTVPGLASNQMVNVLDRWRKEGDVKRIQRFTTSNPIVFSAYSNLGRSDFYYSDASHIRLRNLNIGYKFPQRLLANANIQSCTINFSCQNLLTITNYRGLDPESLSNSSLPPLRVFTFGISISI